MPRLSVRSTTTTTTITIAYWFVDCLANVDFGQFVDFDIYPMSFLSGFRGLCGF